MTDSRDRQMDGRTALLQIEIHPQQSRFPAVWSQFKKKVFNTSSILLVVIGAIIQRSLCLSILFYTNLI